MNMTDNAIRGKLKNCPFCKGLARKRYQGDCGTYAVMHPEEWVECTICLASTQRAEELYRVKFKNPVEAWNTRHPAIKNCEQLANAYNDIDDMLERLMKKFNVSDPKYLEVSSIRHELAGLWFRLDDDELPEVAAPAAVVKALYRAKGDIEFYLRTGNAMLTMEQAEEKTKWITDAIALASLPIVQGDTNDETRGS